MKILFLSAANCIHTVRWVNAISAKGHEVVLVSQSDHKNLDGNISDDVSIRYLSAKGMKGYYLNAIALKRFFQKEKPDVVNVHYASGYGTLARIARLPRYILSVWGSDVYDFPYESKIKECILRKNLSYAYVVASTSNCMADQTRKFLNKEREIKITPFGVDVSKFYNKAQKNARKEFVFGVVKTLSEKYGIDTIIKAFANFMENIAYEERPYVKLEVYGKGELLGEFQNLVKNRGLESNVYFGGFVDNNLVPDILNNIDVFLLGSRLESFGVAAVEAMACEIPVIATRASGFQEVIEDGETGLLVDIDAADQMSVQMLNLYKDNELRRKIGVAGRQRVERLYDWDKNVDTMLNIYEMVAR